MLRSLMGRVGGPLVAGAIAVTARVINGRRLRILSAREREGVAFLFPGVDLRRVRVAEESTLPLLPGFVAITLGHSIYVRGRLEDSSSPLLAHELAHVRQFAERGWLRMTAEYAVLWLRHGYAAHPMELEARAAELGMTPGRSPVRPG